MLPFRSVSRLVLMTISCTQLLRTGPSTGVEPTWITRGRTTRMTATSFVAVIHHRPAAAAIVLTSSRPRPKIFCRLLLPLRALSPRVQSPPRLSQLPLKPWRR
ncbi:hypothetical protein HD806DRAFT_508984 [Xylariaceae sp. AK1471]|nr:hypothetical protein HD806DRAFT_508984 [Xylariaceae sp. AK1471]